MPEHCAACMAMSAKYYCRDTGRYYCLYDRHGHKDCCRPIGGSGT